MKAVLFDYGNTLVPYGPEQVAHECRLLGDFLAAEYGRVDRERLDTVRRQQIVAVYDRGCVEHTIRQVCRDTVCMTYGFEPDPDVVERMVAERARIFLAMVRVPPGVTAVLDAVACDFRMALVSNYPNGDAIVASVRREGLERYFETIVVSGHVGYVKPHAKPFATALAALGVAAGDCVHVGDNWLADIQGAKRIGMRAVHTTQYVSYEDFQPFAGDHAPDAVIRHLEELPAALRRLCDA